MTVIIQGDELRNISLGAYVPRADASLPQGAAEAIFTVTGGRVIVTSINGLVGTAIQATPNATKLTANPTVGTSVDLCATLDITGDEAGSLYSITGTLANALAGGAAGAVAAQANPVVCATGTIDLDCAGSATGTIGWSLTYVPLDDGASIVAA